MAIVTFKKTDFAPQPTPVSDGKRKIVIAVDGLAASGKGTLARMMAKHLGYAYLDTGALYRAVALATLETGGNPAKLQDVEKALRLVKPHLTPELLASPALRSSEVSDAASQIAALPEVRASLLDYQREFAKNPPVDANGVVLDGRDIGTVVCPDADIKFFVTAAPEERARRRYEEMKVLYPKLTLEKVQQEIQQRDQRDTDRKVSPAVAAKDAYVLDTSKLSPDAGLEEVIAVVRSKFLAESGKSF